MKLTPVSEVSADVSFWEIAIANDVKRQTLRVLLGSPQFTENDSTRTYGGEEDWWCFQTDIGSVFSICLRVPYGDAILYSSVPTASVTAAACLAFSAIKFAPHTDPRLL